MPIDTLARLLPRGYHAASAVGNPWHGRIDAAGLHLPGGRVVASAVPAMAPQTWLTAWTDRPSPPAVSGALAALGGEWRSDVCWHTCEKRYSPLSEQGLGYMSWLWRSSSGVYRLWLDLAWDKPVYPIQGEPVVVTLSVSAQRFGRFALEGDAPAVAVLLTQQYTLAGAGTGPYPVAPLIDHTPDGSRTAVTLRLGPATVPNNLQAGNVNQARTMALSYIPMGLVELVCVDADGQPSVSAALVVDSAAAHIETETAVPAAAPNTLLHVTYDDVGRCMPAAGGSDRHRSVQQFVAGCYDGVGLLQQVWMEYDYWAGPAGVGRVALPDEVLTPVRADSDPTSSFTSPECGGASQLNTASYSAGEVDVQLVTGQYERAEYRLRIGSLVVEMRRFEGAGSVVRSVTAPAVDWSPGPICRLENGEWSAEVPLQQVVIGAPVGSAQLSLDGDLIGSADAPNADSMTIIGAIAPADPVRGRWYKFRPIACAPRLFALLAGDWGGGTPAAPRLWAETVHSSHGGAVSLPVPVNVGVYGAELVASMDPRSGEIAVAPAGGRACFA